MRWVFAIHRWAHKATLWVLTQPIFHLPLFFTSFIISLFYSNNRSAPNIAILCLFIWYFKESIIRLYQCYFCTCIYNVIYMCTLSLAPSIFPLIWFFGDKIDTVFFRLELDVVDFLMGYEFMMLKDEKNQTDSQWYLYVISQPATSDNIIYKPLFFNFNLLWFVLFPLSDCSWKLKLEC